MTIVYLSLFLVLGLFIGQLPYLVKVFRWLLVDVYRFFTEPRKLHLYGMWMFCGLPGYGKTMALTEYLIRMRDKYGDKIYISTNYGFEEEDFPLTCWQELLTEYDRPVIFGYDEIQNEFNSRNYMNFPYELVKLLTQYRKGHGKQIVCTAQRYGRVDKTIRELCTHIVECRTVWFGRVTKLRQYDVEDYEQFLNEIDVIKKHKIPCKKYRFIQTDELRGAYDSFKMLDSAKQKEYISASEKLGLRVAEEMVQVK